MKLPAQGNHISRQANLQSIIIELCSCSTTTLKPNLDLVLLETEGLLLTGYHSGGVGEQGC